MKVSGWYESEYGVSFFDYEDQTLSEIAKAMIEEYHDDCIGVDIDANDDAGNDVSAKLANLLHQHATLV
tara:strand:- start:254 stop:460 length:207 start_codon:yes stop_codon:yes gene_type:complete